ncbi:hypothetical protein [Acinetobacter bereziniae]|uniref:hypothetical protein n=1 Tax=Acinetobacter bereziniae TaxID=106648 RepID=UPI001250A669|nr:hypothetical protein [Acinetobacter bereziniae]
MIKVNMIREYNFVFEITYFKSKKEMNIKGEMVSTGAEQVILFLLEKYPSCKGEVKRKRE